MKLVEPALVENAQCGKVQRFNEAEASSFVSNLQEMLHICMDKGGVGLAAPQVGIFQRFFIAYNPLIEEWRVFLNAEYKPTDGSMYETVEGCLTYPKEQKYTVNRHKRVIATWQELNPRSKDFSTHTDELDGFYAQVYQHETDHLNGITIKMIGKRFESKPI